LSQKSLWRGKVFSRIDENTSPKIMFSCEYMYFVMVNCDRRGKFLSQKAIFFFFCRPSLARNSFVSKILIWQGKFLSQKGLKFLAKDPFLSSMVTIICKENSCHERCKLLSTIIIEKIFCLKSFPLARKLLS
jgi:hypothetical protein